jgi:hypothetical protein
MTIVHVISGVIIVFFLYCIYVKIQRGRHDVNVALREISKMRKQLNALQKINGIQDKIRRMPIRRKLLIIGCGRSGTTYTANVLKRLGVVIEHEKDAEDGIVSWYMTVDDNSPYGPKRGDYVFDLIIHQVRNPLHVIASAHIFSQATWDFIGKHINHIDNDDPVLIKGAKYWYYWNLLAEKRSRYSYKVEDFNLVAKKIIQEISIGQYSKEPFIQQSKKTNTKKHITIDLKEIQKEDMNLYHNIIKLAKKYGYSNQELGI